MASSKRNIQSLSPFSLFRLFFLRPKFCAFFRKVKVLKLLSAEHLNFYGPTLQPPFGTNMMGCIKCTAFDSGPASLGKEFNFSKHFRGFHESWSMAVKLWPWSGGPVWQCLCEWQTNFPAGTNLPSAPPLHLLQFPSHKMTIEKSGHCTEWGKPHGKKVKKVAKLLLCCIWANWKR